MTGESAYERLIGAAVCACGVHMYALDSQEAGACFLCRRIALSSAIALSAEPPAMLDHALACAEQLGRGVFPCNPRNKAPYLSKEEGGQGYKDATTDPDVIRKMWERFPTQSSVGVPAPTKW